MKKIVATGLCFLFLVPAVSEASHNRDGINRSDLDDDIEEDISVPVLFYPLEALVPDFGTPRGGGTRSHEGQDMLAPKGTPIVSPTEAIVIEKGTWSGAGKYVTTANPGGETFRYMHLDAFANISRGDRLDPGDFIGTVGDTGNAPDGVYHLHFEVLDEDRNPQDPYPRITEEFSLREQVSFLRGVFSDIRNDEEYAEFLVETYPDVFHTAYEEGWSLPREIEDILEDQGVDDAIEAKEDLADVLELIPQVLQTELETGDSSVLVSLLQLYLIYTTDGPERDRLALAGPTGYYGTITADAVRAFQADHNVSETGKYDASTRAEMVDRRTLVLNL